MISWLTRTLMSEAERSRMFKVVGRDTDGHFGLFHV